MLRPRAPISRAGGHECGTSLPHARHGATGSSTGTTRACALPDRGGLCRALRWRETAADDSDHSDLRGVRVPDRLVGARRRHFDVRFRAPGPAPQPHPSAGHASRGLPHLKDYVLAAYAAPRTHRTPQDWQRVTRLAASVVGSARNRRSRAVFGTVGRGEGTGPGGPIVARSDAQRRGRQARGRDRRPRSERLVSGASERIEEVWFRGAHCDIVGGPRSVLAAGRHRTGLDAPTALSRPAWPRRRGVRYGPRPRRLNSTHSPEVPSTISRPGTPPSPMRRCTPASTSTSASMRSIGAVTRSCAVGRHGLGGPQRATDACEDDAGTRSGKEGSGRGRVLKRRRPPTQRAAKLLTSARLLQSRQALQSLLSHWGGGPSK